VTVGERLGAAALTAFGVAAIVGAATLPFGTVTRPAAGFFPLCLAVGLTVVATLVLLRALRAPRALPTPEAPSRDGLARAAAALAALLVYAFVLEPAGFALATFALIAFLFRVIEPRPWPIALGGAAVTVVVAHVVFRVWLGVRLPAGPAGF
jgi:putative tricarboxylic transport membrane protein